MDLIDEIEREQVNPNTPVPHVGDTVEVHYLIKEGDKERIQLFIGTVMSIKGRGLRRAVTVRRIVQGEGVERSFPVHSPRVKDIVITRRGDVRRAKLYYLRERVGKGTRVKELLGDKVRRDREAEKARRKAVSAAAAEAESAEAAAEATPEAATAE